MGKKRDSERTKERLLSAVDKIVKTKGFQELKVLNIESVSGIDKKLIYFHFTDLKGLISAYLTRTDFWMNIDTPEDATLDKDLALGVLLKQFDEISSNKKLQNVLIWELAQKDPLLRKLADSREKRGEGLLKAYEESFAGTDVDFRAISALLIGGIYYLNLHYLYNGSKFCGLDFKKQEDKARVKKSLDVLLTPLFDQKKRKKK
ncbi:TetR/AcrR family transcriptional regulator [Sphingobacterium sp. SYP-B4668]|uniref:TetR/AcrR family transcriptional regulator n=1 Tax=Sphingobacterium sp. SYP-B4668 TaxID=2996035 RepID=UPI0022DD8D81|nr:TetR/AcrR family transcriptional regulator [Sphingobacterium sp. SYP-B4668]